MMKMNKYSPLVILAYFLILLLFSPLSAEDCRIIKDYQDGTYLVRIDGKNLLVISEDMEKEMLKVQRDLLDARRQIAEKDKLLEEHEKVKAQYDITLKHHKEYIQELEGILKGYKELVNKYKKLGKTTLSVQTGVGATGDFEPAVLFGLGYKRLRLWGFLQDSNAGGLIGLEFPIF